MGLPSSISVSIVKPSLKVHLVTLTRLNILSDSVIPGSFNDRSKIIVSSVRSVRLLVIPERRSVDDGP